MSVYPPLSESNRFTIADYYDRSDHGLDDGSNHHCQDALPASTSFKSSESTGARLQLHDPQRPPAIPSSLAPTSSATAALDRPLPKGIRPLPPVPAGPSQASAPSPVYPLAPLPLEHSPVSFASTTVAFRHEPSPSPSPSPLPTLNRHSIVSDVSTPRVDGYANEKPGDQLVPVLDHGVAVVRQRWWQRIIPTSTACRLLLLVVILETIIDIAIEANILWRFNKEVDENDTSQTNFERKRRLPIFLVIYGLAHLWQLVLVFIAVINRNTVQVIAVTMFNFAFLGYAVIQIYELRQILGDLKTSLIEQDGDTLLTLPLNVLTGVVIGVVSAGSLALLVLAYFVRREFGWQRYRFLGADLEIRRYYFWFQVYECVCYFSAFFCAGFGIQFIWLVLQKTDVEYIITWVAFPLLILVLVLGRFAAKFEYVSAMGVFMLGLLVGCAYFVFKLVRIWQGADTTYVSLTKSLTVFNALSLASLMACFALGTVVWRNFGRGLKEALVRRVRSRNDAAEEYHLEETKSKGDESFSVSEKALRRISID